MKYLLFLMLFSSVCYGQGKIIWDSPIPVSGMEFGNLHPRIVLNSNEDPVILWGKSAESAAYISTWDGTGFTTPLRVNPMDMPLFTAAWAGPDIAASGDTIYVVFKKNPEDSQPAYCVHSYDGGETFSIPVVIDAMAGSMLSRFPSVTVSNSGEPYIVYMQFDAGFVNPRYVVTTSSDFGNSFSMPVLASGYSGGNVCDCCPAGIAANNNYVASLYRDNLSNLRNSWAGISSNYGASFDDGIQIDQTNWIINACPSTGPDGVIIGDSLYSVFMSAGGGDERVYFSGSSLTTLTDNPDKRLTSDFMGLIVQNYPRIANNGSKVAIIWKQQTDAGTEASLLFTLDISDGLPAIYDTVALSPEYGIENADVAVATNYVHTVWQDNENDVVMYRKGSISMTTEITGSKGENKFIIFPNPSDGAATVVLNNGMQMEYINVTNLQGELLKFISKPLGNLALNLSAYSPGMYFITGMDISGAFYSSTLFID